MSSNLPLLSNHSFTDYRHLHPQTPLMSCYPRPLTKCALTKKGERFLTSLATAPPSSTHRLITNFVLKSPKSVSLTTLHHLLSPNPIHPLLSSLAFPLYMKIMEESWFSWNSKLAASIIASLYRQGKVEEAEGQISETVLKMCLKERDQVAFYSSLIDSLVKFKSDTGFSSTCAHLKELLRKSSSTYVRKRAYESLVGGLCVMGLPHDANDLIDEMRCVGIKPSHFEFRSLVDGYGKLGLFEEMLHSVNEMENKGFALDTITSNMVLSSFGVHNELLQMTFWLQKMKALGIGFSVRTYNSVLNSCPTLMSLLLDLKHVPISVEDLTKVLNYEEALLVRELIGSHLLNDLLTWNSMESKLDLHGMHLTTSYLIMLQWMDELRIRFSSGQYEIPAEITVVCGLGKHSSVRGNSPIKAMVRHLVLLAGCPLRIDRKNTGCFITKGNAVLNWLC